MQLTFVEDWGQGQRSRCRGCSLLDRHSTRGGKAISEAPICMLRQSKSSTYVQRILAWNFESFIALIESSLLWIEERERSGERDIAEREEKRRDLHLDGVLTVLELKSNR